MNNWLKNVFTNPGSAYRAKPFWAWNSRLEPQELRRQIRIMKHMGMGGFFMHSRVGLATPYLAPEWFDCVKACVDEAGKLDMEAWLYDEDRWSSGAAGGKVTKNPQYRQRELVLRILDRPSALQWQKITVAAFTAQIDERTAHTVTQIPRGTRPRTLVPGQSILVFEVLVNACGPWYNNYTYPDTLNPAAIREFLRITHEAYRQQVGQHFGRTIPGIFTDEPNYGAFLQNPDRSPWTDALPAVFLRRYGYDLLPHLPEIFFDVDGRSVSQARYHFHDCVTHMFMEAFAKQIGDWCGRNNLQFTGHVLDEPRLGSQTRVVGSCLRFYEHMQAPGMDSLTEHWREYDTAKQVSSAARQFGRKWRITEIYGCTGWDFPFAGHKAVGDWQVALGINVRCPHLAWYSMEGEAKRDYPASIFYQSPWWESYPLVENYFARVHATMTRGTEVRDLLVLHPIESMWLKYRRASATDPQVHAYDRMLIELRDNLLAANIDFDYGDEDILARYGRVRRQELRVARAGYTTVLVPPSVTMRSSTLTLLKKFHSGGGRVIFAGEIPAYLDALPSRQVREFARQCLHVPARGPALVAAVEPARRISIADAAGKEIIPTLHLLKEDAGAFYLFVCNTSRDFLHNRKNPENEPRAVERKLAFPDVRIRGFAGCTGVPFELNPTTGAVVRANARQQDAGWEIRTTLPALGSRLFVIPKRKIPVKLAAPRQLTPARATRLAQTHWPVTLSEANNIAIDRPRYKIGTGAWRQADEILRVDRAVRAALGVPPRGGQMVQPWARTPTKNPRRIPVTLVYSFAARALPTGDLFIALEQPQTFRITVNGVPINPAAECGWWTDRSLRKLRLEPATLRLGNNEIRLECDYVETHPGLEIIYLLGNFGAVVTGQDVTLTKLPATLRLSDWCRQGLPFYSGSVAYGKTLQPKLRAGERLFVQIPDYRGVAVRVLVNGRLAGIAAWEPHEVEITDLVGNAPVHLQVEVLGHRRNSHGPFHLKQKWPIWTGPGEFGAGKDSWFDGYQRVPCGLMRAPVLAVRR